MIRYFFDNQTQYAEDFQTEMSSDGIIDKIAYNIGDFNGASAEELTEIMQKGSYQSIKAF